MSTAGSRRTRSKRRHRFVVGYSGDGNCIYGAVPVPDASECRGYTNPLTLNQAQRRIKTGAFTATVRIFELVPIKGAPVVKVRGRR